MQWFCFFFFWPNLRIYICVKLSHGNLNPDPYPPYLTSTYTYRVTIAFMWRLVRGNVLEFLAMFKDSHVWLQITPGN